MGASGKRKLVRLPKRKSLEWNYHLAFSEKFTKIIKSEIHPVFQTSFLKVVHPHFNQFERSRFMSFSKLKISFRYIFNNSFLNLIETFGLPMLNSSNFLEIC